MTSWPVGQLAGRSFDFHTFVAEGLWGCEAGGQGGRREWQDSPGQARRYFHLFLEQPAVATFVSASSFIFGANNTHTHTHTAPETEKEINATNSTTKNKKEKREATT